MMTLHCQGSKQKIHRVYITYASNFFPASSNENVDRKGVYSYSYNQMECWQLCGYLVRQRMSGINVFEQLSSSMPIVFSMYRLIYSGTSLVKLVSPARGG